ncbi:MAG: FtsW/RodA/SpoVE family cell cycle protein [Gemmatimonadota bacterium]|jgi:cell division protein FtsW (lipid II flippase)|nr:FtsW/RodA/SpoVE family cell cycle protein [Gemmatimonadota bacterium]
MSLASRFRLRRTEGPEGVAVRLRPHNRPSARGSGRVLPDAVWWGLLGAGVFYLLAHWAIVRGVWPVHGTSPGAGATLVRDGVAFVAWLGVLLVIRAIGYRGSWLIVALPVIIFFLTRPALFQAFTDPVYQAARGTRAEANTLKATRARLSTVQRAYGEERQALVFGDEAPPLPDPLAEAARGAGIGRGTVPRAASHFSVLLAPLALLVGFLLARRRETLRWMRERRRIPFAITLSVFFVLTLFFTRLGKVGGTTPWEIFLPVFLIVWAGVLADDAYNLARPGQVVAPRRLLGLFVYGALPVVPFLVIRELGLSVVLAGSLAAMLLVGTRRGWWAGLMLAVWAVLVIAAFSLDPRSSNRLELAYDLYRDHTAMSASEQERWAATVYQIKLFDANVLAGGLLGSGPGQGHGETAPNAADDGYITLLAAQWGWVGNVAIVLLYTLFLVQMLAAAARERGAFERTLITGVATLIGIPFWLATLGGIRVIPLTGVAAAFAASGGAKLLASALAVGLVAGISHRREEQDRLDDALAAPDAAPHGIQIR